MSIITTQKISPSGKLNAEDLKKWGMNGLKFVAPTLVIFFSLLSQGVGVLGAGITTAGILNKIGALDGVKNWWNTPTNGQQLDATSVARDITTTGEPLANINSQGMEPYYKGGYIKNYAQGGLVALSLYNALRG